MPSDPELHHPDRLNGFPHPRESSKLIGHQKAEHFFLEACAHDRLHHAWLLQGLEGVGKATFAYHIAKYILENDGLINTSTLEQNGLVVDKTSQNVQFIISGNHPNLFTLHRQWREKTKKYASQITVDNVREVHHFLGRTAGKGRWRIVIIDRADDLNLNAANALLKMLEEPPGFCLFLLISSEPGRLPVTIRSRCQKLRLDPLQREELILATKHVSDASGVALPPQEEQPLLFQLASGSVRMALELATGHTLKDYKQIEKILDLLPRVDPQTTVSLAEQLSARLADQEYESYLQLLFARLGERIRQLALERQGDKVALAHWAELWETVVQTKSDVDRLNLDRGSFILDLFTRIEETARLYGGLRLSNRNDPGNQLI